MGVKPQRFPRRGRGLTGLWRWRWQLFPVSGARTKMLLRAGNRERNRPTPRPTPPLSAIPSWITPFSGIGNRAIRVELDEHQAEDTAPPGAAGCCLPTMTVRTPSRSD